MDRSLLDLRRGQPQGGGRRDGRAGPWREQTQDDRAPAGRFAWTLGCWSSGRRRRFGRRPFCSALQRPRLRRCPPTGCALARRRHDGPMADPRAGQPAQPQDLVDLPHLVTAYYTRRPRPRGRRPAGGVRHQRAPRLVARHGVQRDAHPRHHPGDLRLPQQQGYDGPLFLGRDTHGLSEPAWATALEVLAANDVTVLVDSQRRATRRPRRSPTRSSAPTGAAPPARAGRRDRGDAVAQPAAATAASSTTRRTAAPPTPTRPR